jgi:peptidyl-prolyl cis-trans isomerase B (cyclophilin B)
MGIRIMRKLFSLLILLIFVGCANKEYGNSHSDSSYKHPLIKITTSKGVMIAELYEDKAPNTVANFIQLIQSGFYKEMYFHRVLKGFMAQGGCPNTKPGGRGRPGTGGPGYTFDNEIHPSLKHDARGVLSMANRGADTNGCQFFVLFGKSAYLDGGYSVFGQVIEGLDVLDKIEDIGQLRDGRPPKELVKFSIEMISHNDHEYKVKKN